MIEEQREKKLKTLERERGEDKAHQKARAVVEVKTTKRNKQNKRLKTTLLHKLKTCLEVHHSHID